MAAEARSAVVLAEELASLLACYRARVLGAPVGKAATAAAGGEASPGAGGGGAKKPRPLAPAPPPAVATAALLVRGAAARVLGLRPGRCGGELQPLWVTEPGQGKITLSLEGSSRSPFPKESAHEALIDAVEQATAELVEANSEVAIFELARAEAEKRFGAGVCDAVGAAPPNGDEKLRLAWLPGAALVALPPNWILCARTGTCGKVQFWKGAEEGSGKKPDTLILAKKKQMSVRFSVAVDAPAAPQDLRGGPPERRQFEEVDSGRVRFEVRGVDVDVAEPSAAAKSSSQPKQEEGEDDMIVNEREVKGKIDYDKLINQFGSTRISQALLARIERLTVGKGRVSRLHRWLRRDIFFSHRDLEPLCKCIEEGQPFYLYTGRGPSSAAMHIGHLIPFMMTKWLQEAFDVPLVIQMTDDEKFLWKGTYDEKTGDNLMHYRHLTHENAKDIIACGFDKSKTFIFSDLDYVGHMYPNIVRIWKAVTYNTARGAFGFVGESNIGQSAFPAIQAAPSFPSSFPVPLQGKNRMCCLIPCAIDQDPYFRVTRDIAHKLTPTGHPLGGKPALLHSKFFPPLPGAKGKMSASDETSAIFLTDTAEQIETKIMKYAFSGGQDTAKEQREKGANLEEDVSYQWLRFFLEDDGELEKIGSDYSSGQGEYWNTGSVKKRLIVELQRYLADFQAVRAKITDAEVREWMRVRKLEF